MFLSIQYQIFIPNEAVTIKELQVRLRRTAVLVAINKSFASCIFLSDTIKPKAKIHVRVSPKVVIVGDGINDSPALVAADLDIALCSDTDIVIEVADIVLMRGDITDMVAAIDLSRSIFKHIKLNFIWAKFHLHPMMARAAMACSSVSVVCSSLLLRWWSKPHWIDDDNGGVEKVV
ncbi:11062_t:CDS:2 [Funneliformis caledonium]|uniref:11062_t:CDS:1 n=1 Tax=Funneliformis caledonium TaxID=1117310 RepID=A0A9N9ILQ9_9GLOM|nr:11062_t:CDS:2 [Funneliformis caledonium]